jgi:hypothetical protein
VAEVLGVVASAAELLAAVAVAVDSEPAAGLHRVAGAMPVLRRAAIAVGACGEKAAAPEATAPRSRNRSSRTTVW